MSFIRTKKFNGKEYAYLVESKWYKRKLKGKSKGPRQKVAARYGCPNRRHNPRARLCQWPFGWHRSW